MSKAPNPATTRILSPTGYAVGVGVLVGDQYILTCAHVVAQAIGCGETEPEPPRGFVLLEFPFVATGQVLKAAIECWHPVQPEFTAAMPEDIAVLKLSSPLPAGAKGITLMDGAEMSGHSFDVFGFPEAHNQEGAWAQGELVRPLTNGWIQVVGGERGYQIEPGYSGSPVWDQEMEAVVGITVAADLERPEFKVGYMIPTTVLVEAWPPLKEWVTFPLTPNMTAPANLNESPAAQPKLEIDQAIKGDRNQAVGQVSGGAAFAHVEGQQIHIDNRTYNADPETVKRLVREELKLAHSEYGDPVGQGLGALAELMDQVPAVKESVFQFRIDFEAASSQINVIANYKVIHDVLHTLEKQCYDPIVREATRFPDDDLALEALEGYEQNLQRELYELQQVIVQESIATSEVLWLTDLQNAQAQLNIAIEELEVKPLKTAISWLNRILTKQPNSINEKLVEAAKALRLSALVEALKFIAETLTGANLDASKLEQFEQGVAVLATLEERLTALIIAHAYWQAFDGELRRIEVTLIHDLIELETFWPDLQDQADKLLDADADDWTKDFQKHSQNLNAAIQAENPAKVMRYFRAYRRHSSDRFFQVDVTLKRLCEELREVGGPLALVLKMLD